MQLPLTLNLQPSRKLALLLVVAHLAALTVVGLIDLPAWITLALILLVAISLWTTRTHWCGARRIVVLRLHDKGVLEFVRQNHELGECSIHLQSTVTPLMTVILLRQRKRLESLVLLSDSLSQDDYRRLRTWLRWQVET